MAAGPGSLVGIVILFSVAALLFAMAVLFFVIGHSSRILHASFTIAAATLGAVGVLLLVIAVALLLSRANARRLRAEGIPGQAQVVGLEQTGLYVNGQPVVELQLQVMTATGAPYVVTRRETVPAGMTGLLTNGRPLPVVVDPARPDNLVILWESALSVPAVAGG